MIHRLALFALVTAAFPTGLSAADHGGRMTPRLIISPWDANAWEPGSAQAFWRAGNEGKKAKNITPTEPASPSPTKTAPPVSSPKKGSTKSDFPNRQTEK